jgi:hypothetical protein
MKRGTRATRALGWATLASLAVAVAAVAIGVAESQGGNAKLALAVGDLRARAAETSLLAQGQDEATGTYTRMQAMQLASRITQASDELSSVHGGDDAVKKRARTQADALLASARRLQSLPAKDERSAMQAELDAIAQALLALERSIS